MSIVKSSFFFPTEVILSVSKLHSLPTVEKLLWCLNKTTMLQQNNAFFSSFLKFLLVVSKIELNLFVFTILVRTLPCTASVPMSLCRLCLFKALVLRGCQAKGLTRQLRRFCALVAVKAAAVRRLDIF